MCEVGRCHQPMILTYTAFGANRIKDVRVCERHWIKHCDDEDKFDLILHFYPVRKRKT